MMKKRYETFGLISFCHAERGGFACCGCSLPVRSLRRPTSSRSAKHPVLLLRISCFSQLTRIASSFRIPHDEKKDMKPSASYLFVMRREGDSNPRGGFSRLHAFQACAFSRSAISPTAKIIGVMQSSNLFVF